MNLEATSEQAAESQLSIPLPFPGAVWGRVLYGIYIIVLPALAFWGAGALKPEWQSGEFSDYLALFLTPEASLVFLLLLVYSVICYLLLLVLPTRFSQSFFIRFGTYTGTLLALQYSILSGIFFFRASFNLYLILLWILPIVLGAIHRWAVKKWDAPTVNSFWKKLFVAVILISALIMREHVLVFLPMVLVMAAPFWSLLIAIRAAIWLFKNYETPFTLPRGLGLAAWLAAYGVAWRFDILKMYELYAALPKTPPDCYIATAAVRGHPRFVHAWTVQHADGKSMQVNAQLQRLKCAELALMAIHPRTHKLIRQIYDVIGKHLARRIQNPFLADVAYLLLKPCEWFAGLLLKIIVPEIDSISKKMYM